MSFNPNASFAPLKMQSNKPSMNARRPRSWRRLLSRFHYWLGAVASIYVVFISVSGCAIVFEPQLYVLFSPAPRLAALEGASLSKDQMMLAAMQQYPQNRVVGIWERRIADDSVAEIWLDAPDGIIRRLFHPRTGIDLGEAQPTSLRALATLRSAHMHLFAGPAGRVVNAIGALALLTLSFSGIVIRRTSRVAVPIRSIFGVRAYHEAAGLLTCLCGAIWGVTGLCFSFPSLIELILNSPAASERVFEWMYIFHSGSFGGWLTQLLWIISALAVSSLAITGMLMWGRGIANTLVFPRLKNGMRTKGVSQHVT
jgi:uncharacterized iron-regulated membrane protein